MRLLALLVAFSVASNMLVYCMGDPEARGFLVVWCLLLLLLSSLACFRSAHASKSFDSWRGPSGLDHDDLKDCSLEQWQQMVFLRTVLDECSVRLCLCSDNIMLCRARIAALEAPRPLVQCGTQTQASFLSVLWY